jgi:hypothetical protein
MTPSAIAWHNGPATVKLERFFSSPLDAKNPSANCDPSGACPARIAAAHHKPAGHRNFKPLYSRTNDGCDGGDFPIVNRPAKT